MGSMNFYVLIKVLFGLRKNTPAFGLQLIMENLMVIRVEVIAPENPLDSDYNICKRLEIT